MERIHIVTNRREIGSGGGNGGGSQYSFQAPPGNQIVGFYGGAGEPAGGNRVYIDAIGVKVAVGWGLSFTHSPQILSTRPSTTPLTLPADFHA